MKLLTSIKNSVWTFALNNLTNPNKIVTVHKEYKIILDKKDSLLLSLKSNYEPDLCEYMKQSIKEGDIVVDVGANIGYFTILMSKLVGKSGKVYAFEPDKENFEILRKNIADNSLNNVVLENKAVSSKNEKLKVYLSNVHSGDTRVYPTKEKRRCYNIDAVSLDDYFKNKATPNFIKIDVQGYEPAVFNGMKDILNSGAKFSFEFYPDYISEAGFNPYHLLIDLENHGLYELSKDKIEFIAPFVDGLKRDNYFTTIIGGMNER